VDFYDVFIESREMKRQENTPMWVYLAFASVETRRGAFLMFWLNALCCLYCIPWSQYTNAPWVGKMFIIDNWVWLIMMVAITLWYWLSLKWTDRHNVWSEINAE
jgi:hypothetical protein